MRCQIGIREMPTKPIEQIAWGWIHPYHGKEPKDRYEHIACAIISDLLDRRGIKWEFEQVDSEIRPDIVEAMASYIKVGVETEELPKLKDFDEYMEWRKGVA